MSLTLALNTALSGLNVNQQSLATLSQNIANANNPGYSRKIITQDSVYLQGSGAGVRIENISRKVDAYLQKSVRNQGSDYGRYEVLSDYSDRLQVLLGNPGSQNSIYSYATSFFNTLQSLSQTPENASLRTSVVNIARSTAQTLSTLADSIYDMQYAIDQDISRAISSINDDLEGIHVLNSSIASNKLLGRPVSELEDKRDLLLADLSSYMDIHTYEQTNGVLNVFVAGGYSLVDEDIYALKYNSASSSDFFANGNPTAAINIYRLGANGNITGNPNILTTSGVGTEVTTLLNSGKLKGLLEMRDRQLPDVLAKLDSFAATMRDKLNEVHNAGVAFPGAYSYTGTRELNADDYSEWTGKVRIAVLDRNGNPIASDYSDESSGMRPLLIDMETLDSGNGEGSPSLQGIINEINYYYGVPNNKVKLGDINDVRLVLNNTSIPGTTPQLDFDFQLENISGADVDFYVRDIQVLDDTGTDITDISQDVPSIALASTGTYTTTAGSSTVTVTSAAAHGLSEGDRVYLSLPASDVDGIDADALSGFFIVSNITSTGFEISVSQTATSGGSFDRSNVEARAVYYEAETGTNARSKENGTITADISANTTSDYYTVKATVSTVDADGNISNSVITYRIDNLASNVKNYRYAARSATLDGEVTAPNNITPALTAKMVDANGNELPIVNNRYTTALNGYLKLTSGSSDYVIAIDSMDSAEGGQSSSVAATGRGFSHYFELNNLFTHNRSGDPEDDIAGSAFNMDLSAPIAGNVNLLSLGSLVQSSAPVDPALPPLYTYKRYIGDNSIVLQMADFATNIVEFPAAGDLGENSQTLISYAGQVISTVSSKSSGNKSSMDTSKLLLDGFNSRSDSLRGVNLDEELANTIIYQNAYSASARVITIANQFFESLMEVLR